VARISRIVVPGYPHHITQRGVRSMDVFHSDEDRRQYLQFLSEEAGRYGVDILVWCLMTNHVHFIAIPDEETSLARGFGEGHRRYTRMKNFSQGVRGYLFQGRFGLCVLDEQHLVAAARYVLVNPVRAGMVNAPCEYTWSSARFHAGLTEYDPFVKDRTLKGLIIDWQEFIATEDEDKAHHLRRVTRTGRPAGSDYFVQKIEQVTGRDLSIRMPGRPRKKP
jgi:putative transposase